MAQKIVIDANLCVALIVPLAYSAAAARKWRSWESARVSLYAPTLWEYEIVSALRKAMVAGMINPDKTESALQRLFILGVEVVSPDVELHRSALQWSERIMQPVAYDAQYLALAESLQADLWTADKRLIDALKDHHLTWLHWIGAAS
jgi:predicted nucleic acid-binding protein